MAQGEEYEIWILDNARWGLKAWSRAFDVAWALARVHSVPTRIVRTVYADAFVAERSVIAELNSSQERTPVGFS
jgi:hypothetical protein